MIVFCIINKKLSFAVESTLEPRFFFQTSNKVVSLCGRRGVQMTGVKETGAVTVLQAPVASGPCPANQNLDHKLRRTERSWNHSAWEIWIFGKLSNPRDRVESTDELNRMSFQLCRAPVSCATHIYGQKTMSGLVVRQTAPV